MHYLLLILSVGFVNVSWARKSHLHHFETNLVDNDYKICVLGDTGTGTPHQLRVSEALEKEECDQIRVVGDIIYPRGIRSSNDPLFEEKFIVPYKNIIESPKKPKFFLALGNHDYHGNVKAWYDLHKSTDYLFIPHRYYAETYPEVCIMTFDTPPYDSFKHFLKIFGQGSWARRTQKKIRKDCRFSLAFAHHPYLNVGHHGNAKAFLKLFLKKRVIGKFDIFFAGHEHILSDEGIKKGTTLLISGSAGQLHGSPSKIPAGGYVAAKGGFVTLTLNKNGEGQIVGHYQFKEVDEFGNVSVAHQNTVVGQGLRK